MATGMVLTVAQTLLSAMQTKEVRELCSVFNHESQLAELQRTVETIKAVLLDAESKHQQLNNQGQDWLGKLKDAVYDADDLFDTFNTVAQQHKRMPGGKISKKLLRFFSNDNQLLFAAKASRKIKKLRNKLDGIADDRTKFGFSDVYVPLKRREETSSYVYESSIIGRDADKEAIFGLLLLDSDAVQDNVSFVSIVGIGGLGKTAVAQLVYQDDRIKRAFELTLWVCVSEEFGMKEILSKMLGKSTHSTELTIEELQNQVRPKIEGKRYFLVLDDIWKEDRNEWDMLKQFLILGAKGSRIMVTTRSKRVARAIGDYPMHELEGLSNEDSWSLFQRIAFNSSQVDDDTLVVIGKDIVKKCANVPLSIRVIGSMLYEQEISKWLLFQRIDLAKMGEGEGGIMPILKFSYYNLTPALKSCFSYCALFPKDHMLKKKMLINIWLAEGCLECPNNMRNLEDVGDEYFSILLHRCFFQDIKKNVYGEIDSVKMHDLIHDLAQEVAGKESCLLTDSSTSHFNGKVRHLSVAQEHPPCPISNDTLGKLSTMRTLLRPAYRYREAKWNSNVPIILANCRCLRVLELSRCGLTCLCNTINNLSHLRYLDLSWNRQLEMLPESISKLHNLQVLKLSWCSQLKELPENLRELVNLRHLDITRCDALTHMPPGMGSVSSLCTLTMFVVGGESSNRVQKKGELRELMPLNNLRGVLEIQFRKGYSYNNNNPTSNEEGSYLLNKKHIKALIVEWDKEDFGKPGIADERTLGFLQPHHDLRKIVVRGYKGTRLPGWAATLATTLPHLTSIRLYGFKEVQYLPQLSQIHHLKSLFLWDMPNVEYMEDDNGVIPFFPSLEVLTLGNFPKLKNWWRSEKIMLGVEREGVIPAFDYLRKLEISVCPNLTCFPGIPHVKEVELKIVNEALTFCTRREEATIYLDCLGIDNVGLLSCPFGESVGGFDRLIINNYEVETLSSFVGECFLRHASSIKTLRISNCMKLKSIMGGGIEHMTNLLSLVICDCSNLEMEEDEDGMPWKPLDKLTSLVLISLEKVVKLPKGMQYLSSLESLHIESCTNFEELPEWLHHLTSLKTLRIQFCKKLKSIMGGGIKHMTNLLSLTIGSCIVLEMEEEEDGMPWKPLDKLTSLELNRLEKVVKLPKGMQYLSSLESLSIRWCSNFEELPEWLHHLTSLKTLQIAYCSKLRWLPEAIGRLPSLTTLRLNGCDGLTKRCQQPYGEDWPKISHIPNLQLR